MNSSDIQIPVTVLLTAGGGLVTAVVFIFRLLLVTNERRIKAAEELHASTLKHHETFVLKAQEDRTNAAAAMARLDAQAQADRERYASQLEKLVTSVAADRNVLQRQMIEEVDKLIKEVPSIMVVKLIELGVIRTPARAKAVPRGPTRSGKND